MTQAGEVIAYRTGQLYEMEMVEQAFEQAGIPFYHRVYSLGLGELAMPALPAMGPGTEFLVIIPQSEAERAGKLIRDLPIRQEAPDDSLWTFRPTEKVKTGFRIYALITLLIVVIVFLINLFNALFGSLR